MKWFLILLAIGLTASDKLDRTYLPPPGAQFAGGHPGDIQAPIDPSKLRPIQIGPTFNELQEYGPNGQPIQTPVTTTSYAFTQTTTFPSVESYETTALPINPVTGLPVQNFGKPSDFNLNLPGFAQNQGQQTPSSDTNFQPGFIPQGLGSDGQPINIGSQGYSQAGNQPRNQYASQNTITPGSNIEIPGQYSDNGSYGQIDNQYLGQNANNLGGQTIKFPSEQIIPGQQKYIQPTTSLEKNIANNLPENQYSEIGSQRPLSGQTSQGIYTGQPINVQDVDKPQFDLGYQNQGQLVLGSTASQQPITGSQNIAVPGSILGQNIYQPGQDSNSISSTTSVPSSTASSSAYSSVYPIIRPERPQAAADRNAVILNSENVRTPTAYSYSYDTSNGIHADETGTVGDGTRAQGAYSYTGDDGKVYSVIYTADENGFQPRGDHLPTPPPIPEAIKKVIEQAARDKEAGIIDDGSYDEAKYGYMRYQTPMKHRRPQTQNTNIGKSQLDEGGKIIPITRITDDEYDESILQGQFDDNNRINKKPTGKHSSNKGNNVPTKTSGNRRISENDNGATPYNGINDNQRSNKQGSPGYLSDLNGGHSPATDGHNLIQQDKFDDRNSDRIPTSTDRVKGMKKQYPEPQFEDNDSNYPDSVDRFESKYVNNDSQDIENDSPGTSTTSTGGSPVISNKKQTSIQMSKGNRRPSKPNNGYLSGGIPQSGQHFNQADVEDSISKQTDGPSIGSDHSQNYLSQQSPSQATIQQVDENGYQYNPPQTQFPTRFKEQKVSSTMKPMVQKPIRKGTTARPFLTPEVYNQPSKGRQNNNDPSTTRQPFMTSRVTTPQDSSYSDYDDGEEYTDQDTNNKRIGSTVRPDGKVNIGTRRPVQSTTSKPQYIPSERVNQQGTIAPGYKVDYSDNVTPGYIHGSATPTAPTQNSRFGNTESPHKPTSSEHQRQPTTTNDRPGSTTAVGRPVSSYKSETESSDNGYDATRPVYRQPDSTTRQPGSTAGQPGYGFVKDQGKQVGSISQNYPTTTYYDTRGPSTAGPTVPRYYPDSGAYQPGNSQSGYQYEPIRSEYSTTITQRPTSGSFIPETKTSTPGYYQTTYKQGPVDSTGTTRPSTQGRPGTFILSGPGTALPESSPIGTYQPSYQYGSTTPGSYAYQTSPPGYVYGPAGPVYSTTVSPSTIGTTPGSFTPSSTPGRPFQGYSTTQQPSYPSTQDVYNQSPVVDGFGRPILTEQQPGYSIAGQQPNQYPGTQLLGGQGSGGTGVDAIGTNGYPSGVTPGDNQPPTYYGTQQSSNYPGYYDQPKVIGEDFSRPKQPQRFDPQTGYHY